MILRRIAVTQIPQQRDMIAPTGEGEVVFEKYKMARLYLRARSLKSMLASPQ